MQSSADNVDLTEKQWLFFTQLYRFSPNNLTLSFFRDLNSCQGLFTGRDPFHNHSSADNVDLTEKQWLFFTQLYRFSPTNIF